MFNYNPEDNKHFACKQRNIVATGHWETLNGRGEKVRLVRQHISVKRQGILSPLGRGGMSRCQAKPYAPIIVFGSGCFNCQLIDFYVMRYGCT